MAWADRLYAPLRGRSCAGATLEAGRVLEAYRAVSRRYPNDLRPHLGAARCLFRMGRYEASVSEYLVAKRCPEELAAAQCFVSMADWVRKTLPSGQRVHKLARLGKDRWVAAIVQPGEDYGIERAWLRPFQATPDGPFYGKGISIEGPCWAVDLYAPPALRPFFVAQPSFVAASHLPNSAIVIDSRRGDLRRIAQLKSTYETDLWMEGKRLRAMVTNGYKIHWPDVYEWTGGRFRFANVRYPNYYADYSEPTGELRYDYPSWANYAAALTVQRRKETAIAAWREAERCAAGALRAQTKKIPRERWRYQDYGMYGDTRENLREVRQRIAWLRRGDWNHWLLYRPYDWGLQVWPSRLGRAIPDGYVEW